MAFEFLVEARSDAAADGSLDFEADWPKAGQRSGGFEATGERGVLCAFVDPTDPSARESTGSKATARFTDLPQTQDQLRASFAVQGLKRGDQVVVEVWLAAPRSVPESSSLLQTHIVNGKADEGRSVDIENRTIDYRMSFFDRQEDPTLTLDVNDDPNPAFKRSERIDYTITITNTAQTAIAPAARLDAFLDQQTKLSNVAVTDNEGSITTCAPVADPYGFSCNLGFMNPGESVKLVATVAVQPGAETRWTKEDPGCSGDLVDVCGQFVLSWKQTRHHRQRGARRAAQRHPRRPAAVDRQAGAQGPLRLHRPEADVHLPRVERGAGHDASTSSGSPTRSARTSPTRAATPTTTPVSIRVRAGTTPARSSRCRRTRPRASPGWRRSPTTGAPRRSR